MGYFLNNPSARAAFEDSVRKGIVSAEPDPLRLRAAREAVRGITDPQEALEAMASRDLIPEAWASGGLVFFYPGDREVLRIERPQARVESVTHGLGPEGMHTGAVLAVRCKLDPMTPAHVRRALAKMRMSRMGEGEPGWQLFMVRVQVEVGPETKPGDMMELWGGDMMMELWGGSIALEGDRFVFARPERSPSAPETLDEVVTLAARAPDIATAESLRRELRPEAEGPARVYVGEKTDIGDEEPLAMSVTTREGFTWMAQRYLQQGHLSALRELGMAPYFDPIVPALWDLLRLGGRYLWPEDLLIFRSVRMS